MAIGAKIRELDASLPQGVKLVAVSKFHPVEALKEDFFSFRQYTSEEISACAEILKALASYIHLSGMIQTTEYTDLQRLELYLDQHYMEKLSLSTISAALNISRTKLCTLAKKLSGGNTLSHMIAQRRVAAAKLLLMKKETMKLLN